MITMATVLPVNVELIAKLFVDGKISMRVERPTETRNQGGPTNYRKTPQDTARHRKTPQDTARHPQDTARHCKTPTRHCKGPQEKRMEGYYRYSGVWWWWGGGGGRWSCHKFFWENIFIAFLHEL